METSVDCKPVTNGHLTEDNKLLDSIKNESEIKDENIETNIKNSKESDCNAEQIKQNSSSSADNNSTEVKTKNDEKDTKLQSNIVDKISGDNKNIVGGGISGVSDGGDDVDETAKEPELKKPKIEPSVIEGDKAIEKEKIGSTTTIAIERDVKEEKLALDNSSKTIISTEEEEDISDDAMFLRHEKALTEERRKFQTYLKFPWSTRSRANRRIDSRAESSGANTPDPSSPAPQTPSVGGGDLEVSDLYKRYLMKYILILCNFVCFYF